MFDLKNYLIVDDDYLIGKNQMWHHVLTDFHEYFMY